MVNYYLSYDERDSPGRRVPRWLKITFAAILVGLFALLLAAPLGFLLASSEEPEKVQVPPTEAATPAPTPTPTYTPIPPAAPAPVPIFIPTPTVAPLPTQTPVPVPTLAPTPTHPPAPAPSATPSPTHTPPPTLPAKADCSGTIVGDANTIYLIDASPSFAGNEGFPLVKDCVAELVDHEDFQTLTVQVMTFGSEDAVITLLPFTRMDTDDNVQLFRDALDGLQPLPETVRYQTFTYKAFSGAHDALHLIDHTRTPNSIVIFTDGELHDFQGHKDLLDSIRKNKPPKFRVDIVGYGFRPLHDCDYASAKVDRREVEICSGVGSEASCTLADHKVRQAAGMSSEEFIGQFCTDDIFAPLRQFAADTGGEFIEIIR